MNLFLDTNVLLDVLNHRDPHYEDSAEIWTRIESGQFWAAVSAIVFSTIAYVLRRQDAQTVQKIIRRMLALFTCVPVDAVLLQQSLDLALSDYEDAIQYASAIRAGADVLITRNKGHFPAQGLAIQTPAEFLAARAWKRTGTAGEG